jgi:hypothetical protein
VAFSLKMQEILPALVRIINREKITDFYEAAGVLEEVLKRKGIATSGAKWLADLFDELEYSQSNWKPDKKDLSTLFKLLPNKFKQKITNKMLMEYIPKEDWSHFPQFNKTRANARHCFKESLGDSPIILSEYYGNQLDCSVFLGDITDSIGTDLIDFEKNYDDTYAAIEETIGHDVTIAALKRRLPKEAKIRLIDYPNGSNLQDAKYEFIIESDLDRKSIEKNVVGALQAIGFSLDEI